MIQMKSKLGVADNSGARQVECVKVVGGSKKRYATIGDTIIVSVKAALPNSNVRTGEVMRAVVVRTRKELARDDGTYIRFDDNAAVLIDDNDQPLGTRVFGPVARELRGRKYMRIVSLAPEVL